MCACNFPNCGNVGDLPCELWRSFYLTNETLSYIISAMLRQAAWDFKIGNIYMGERRVEKADYYKSLLEWRGL